MSTAFTTCNACGETFNHMQLLKCANCGSSDVDIDTELVRHDDILNFSGDDDYEYDDQ